MIKPEELLLTAFQCHSLGHPHRPAMVTAISKILNNQEPDENDIEGIIQGFSMQPILCTLDLQEVIDWVNERFDTTYMIGLR